ncbi:MAG: hypothetical protein ACRDRN_26195, partial [Sciscionella sp.]
MSRMIRVCHGEHANDELRRLWLPRRLAVGPGRGVVARQVMIAGMATVVSPMPSRSRPGDRLAAAC